MSRSELTKEQELAVLFREPENLLISAAAGSGKTTTLTRRIVSRLINGEIRPSELLVITFTEMAAKDLKVKIQGQLKTARKAASDPELSRRLDLLEAELSLAQISTIHAFCNQILTSYLSSYTDASGESYLEPGFRIMEETETLRLQDESIEAVLSRLYELLDQETDRSLPPGQTVSAETGPDPAPFVLDGNPISLDSWLSDFRRVSFAYSPDLNDQAFRDALASMLGQLRNLPDYTELVRAAILEMNERAEHFASAGDPWARGYWDLYEESLAPARRTIEKISRSRFFTEELVSSSQKGEKQLVLAVEEMARVISRLEKLEGRDESHWDQVVEIGRSMGEIRLPGLPSISSASEKSIMKRALMEDFLYDVIPFLALISGQVRQRGGRDAGYAGDRPAVFTESVGKIRENLKESAGPAARFMETVLLIDREFQRRRFKNNALVFDDLEHGALALLKKDEISREYRTRFREIYVDEYQDTSSIQDAIIRRIGDRNMLMVGDIKQSIYRFRYANPALFARHEAGSLLIEAGVTPPPLEAHHQGYLALLNRCFRTRPPVIDFINDFFSAFLTKKAGEIEYDESQMLIAAEEKWKSLDREKPQTFGVYLDLLTGVRKPASDEETLAAALAEDIKMTPAAREAFAAARIVMELAGQGIAYDRIAILLHTNEDCRNYETVLDHLGIPVTTRSGKPFSDNLVYRQLEALLSFLDNPLQDIPLISLLVGPFAPQAWTGDELMETAALVLENTSKQRPFFHEKWTRLIDAEDHPLKTKAEEFSQRMENWRFLSQELSVRDLLNHIISETDYTAYLARSPYGGDYLASLDYLLDLFAAENRERPGVRGALDRLQKLMEESAFEGTEGSVLLPGAVRILTRHRSKGLEWDYVILGRLDSAWERAGSRNVVVFSDKEGLSSPSISRDGMTLINNPPFQAMLQAERDRDRAEAWRRLYVAMTRAIHGLYLILPFSGEKPADTASYQDRIARVQRATGGLGLLERTERGLIPGSVLSSLRHDADLLIAYFTARYPGFAQELLALSGSKEGVCLQKNLLPPALDQARITDWDGLLEEVMKYREDNAEILEDDRLATGKDQRSPQELQELQKLLTSPIPGQEAARTPAKVTVTELQRRGLDTLSLLHQGDDAPEPVAFWDKETADMPYIMRQRGADREIRGSALGTAMHTVFQFLDIRGLRQAAAEGGNNYLSQLDKLEEKGLLTPGEKKAACGLDREVMAWAKSPLAGRLLETEEKSGKVYREMPFTLALPSSLLDPSFPADENTLVQGMIDLWFVEEDGQAVLVDFKTDRTGQGDAQKLMTDRYGIQMAAYADAISRATGRRVKEKIIWLVRQGRPLLMD